MKRLPIASAASQRKNVAMKPWLSVGVLVSAILLVLAGCGQYEPVSPGGPPPEAAAPPAPGAAPAAAPAAPDAASASSMSGYGGMILSTLLVLIFAACLGFLYTEGLWSNAIRLVNVITAALLAMNFFEPASRWLYTQIPTFNSVLDFLSLWGLFALFMIVFREITDRVSRVNVRFLKIADQVGGGLLAAWIGWVVVCFTLTTFHAAPLGKNFLFGAFRPGENMFLGMAAPDLEWLGFTKRMSEGAFCRPATAEQVQQQEFVFDPKCEFVSKQSERRTKVEAYIGRTGALRVNPELASKR